MVGADGGAVTAGTAGAAGAGAGFGLQPLSKIDIHITATKKIYRNFFIGPPFKITL